MGKLSGPGPWSEPEVDDLDDAHLNEMFEEAIAREARHDMPSNHYGKYNTPLSPSEETGFQSWKKQYAPRDSGVDYDMRGAYKAGLKPDPKTGHWPDTYKKPNHPTFSDESQYSTSKHPGGHWDAADNYHKVGR